MDEVLNCLKYLLGNDNEKRREAQDILQSFDKEKGFYLLLYYKLLI